MTLSRRPISFVATTDPKAAKAFFGKTLGLNLLESSPYALVFSDGGHMLRVQIVTDLRPAQHTVHGWRVTNIKRDVEELASKGVEFLMFEQLSQSAAGVWTTPNGDKIAWFKDPSGNTLSLTEFTES